jgi:hypothetical protein
MKENAKAGKQEAGGMESTVIARLSAVCIKGIIASGEAFFAHSVTRDLGLMPVRMMNLSMQKE